MKPVGRPTPSLHERHSGINTVRTRYISWWPAAGGKSCKFLQSLLAYRCQRFAPPLMSPRKLWSIVRSLSKGLRQIRAWIDCWASFRSFDPDRRETEPATWQSREVASISGSRAIEVFSERPVDLRTSYCQWLASVSEKGSEPSAAELEEATGKMKGQVPLHFPLELYQRRFESVRPSAAALLHCVKADSGPSVAVLDRIYQQHEMDVPRQTENRQSVLLIHSHIR